MKRQIVTMCLLMLCKLLMAQNWTLTTQSNLATISDISADGTKMVTATLGANFNFPTLRIYDFQNNGWVLDENIDLTNDFNPNDGAGNAVAMSDDKTTIALGVSGYDGFSTTNKDTGLVRLYEVINGSWVQKGDDIIGNNIFTGFGSSVSISGDGNLVAVGADRGAYDDRGYFEVYKFDNGAWAKIHQTYWGSEGFESFGTDIKITRNGQFVAVSGDWGSNGGVVRVYGISGNTITQLGADIVAESVNDYAGKSISISEDGQTVAIGAPENDGAGTDAGHVRVYQYSNNSWSQLGGDIDGLVAGMQWAGVWPFLPMVSVWLLVPGTIHIQMALMVMFLSMTCKVAAG